ncbi:MAG: Tol-Pal system protein TolB [Burkholderiaceae bacterium]|nr:Tol-Pal system protein TolB [Burkholderiaceae bacterium]
MRRAVCAGLVLAGLCGATSAQLRVEITGVGSQQFPVAVATFAREGQAPAEVDSIIRADLARSGLFRMVDPGTQAIPENATINLPDWKGRGADALVVGTVARLADGRFDVRYRLLDTVKQSQLDGVSLVSTAADLRLTAHRIADRIYEKLTGERGVFATRIAYIVQTSPKSWELHIADADGANPQAALKSREPIISPAWSPDGTRLAYVSFESGKPVVYVHSVVSGERRAVANFRGSNSAPAWSPDGRSLAVTLTREGNSQIFLMGADGSNVRRLTTSSGIDTEPAFSTDGSSIYFTSDRGGGPQIYRMPVAGGGAQRVTFNGDYNISARVSPDGKQLAYVGRRGGRFQVYVLDIASGQEVLVTDTASDESPSFAPNGRLLLYATAVNGRGILASASTDGRVRTRLSGPSGDIREPTWGPFVK